MIKDSKVTGDNTSIGGTMARKKRKIERGKGSFRVRDTGRIEFRITIINEYGEKQRKSFSGNSENECIAKYESYMVELEKRIRGINVDATIPEILEERYERDYHMNFIGEPGYARQMETLKILRRNPIGAIPISKVTKQQLLVFLASITSYSNSMIEKIYIQLKKAFAIAKEKEIISKNLMEDHDIRRPVSSKADKKVRGYTPDEQKQLVEAIKSHRTKYGSNSYKNQLLLSLYTGLRMGEINSLRLSDIDFPNRLIHVKRTISKGMHGRCFIKESTKTYAGTRDVPMSKDAEKILKLAISEMRKNPEDLIFYDYYSDSIISTNQVNSFFKRICEKNGIAFNGQHALRHTFATRCIEAGVEPVVLKKWMGHTDIHITLDTYTDVFQSLTNEAINKFEERMNNI